jgi:hypothetical protein
MTTTERVTKSHKLVGDLISVTYVVRNFDNNTVTAPRTIVLEDLGGAKKSLIDYLY